MLPWNTLQDILLRQQRFTMLQPSRHQPCRRVTYVTKCCLPHNSLQARAASLSTRRHASTSHVLAEVSQHCRRHATTQACRHVCHVVYSALLRCHARYRDGCHYCMTRRHIAIRVIIRRYARMPPHKMSIIHKNTHYYEYVVHVAAYDIRDILRLSGDIVFLMKLMPRDVFIDIFHVAAAEIRRRRHTRWRCRHCRYARWCRHAARHNRPPTVNNAARRHTSRLPPRTLPIPPPPRYAHAIPLVTAHIRQYALHVTLSSLSISPCRLPFVMLRACATTYATS